MREMIIDIDDSKSVHGLVYRVSEGWFDPVKMYADLKANGKTNSPNFWGIAAQMLTDVSGSLGWTSAQLMNERDQRCISNNKKLMAYHCTRPSNKRVFIEKGALPLSEEKIKPFEDKDQTTQRHYMWEDRSQRSPGPWFLLRYKCTKSSDNHFLLNSPEILLVCAGHYVDVTPAKSVSMIMHCVIRYLANSEKDYFAFCVMSAYFNFLDPEDDLNNLFDGYSIDLIGKTLDPRHIVKIEEI